MISGNSRHPVLEAQNALIDHDHQPQGTSLIGLPTRYVAGQFSGKIMRAELYELQQAKLGRKFVSSAIIASAHQFDSRYARVGG